MRIWIWLLWALTIVVMALLGIAGRLVAHAAFHSFKEMKEALPVMTIPALGLATHLLWVGLLLSAAAAAVMAWKGAERVGPATLASAWLLFLAACGFIAVGLLVPSDYLCAHFDTWYVR